MICAPPPLGVDGGIFRDPSSPENNNEQDMVRYGASRGIGAEIVKAALAAGDNVVATGRDLARLERLFAPYGDRVLSLQLDVAKENQAFAAVEAAVRHFGRIDVAVNNAGYGQLGPFEENDAEAAERQFATNVFGVFHVCRAVLPVMRRQRAGHIFNVSSIAGVAGMAAPRCIARRSSQWKVSRNRSPRR